MIQKSESEKLALKNAKLAYKKNQESFNTKATNQIKTMVNYIPGKVLDDDYPVHYDYLYFANKKLIRSDIKGTVKDLKYDLISNFGYDSNIVIKSAELLFS